MTHSHTYMTPTANLRKLYQVRGMPTSVFIDREGKIATIWAGMVTADLLNGIITDLQ